MTRPLKLKYYSNASTWCYLFFTAHVALTFSYSAHIQMKPLQQFFVFCMSRNNLFSLFCLQVFFSVVIGAMQLGQAGPNFQAIVTARGAAYKVFLIIDRVKRCILFKGSFGLLFHPCLVFEILWSYSCSPATLPNRASAGSLFTLMFLIQSASVSLQRRIYPGKYINQRALLISCCTNSQVQRQTITEETAIRSTSHKCSEENVYVDKDIVNFKKMR